MSEQIPADPSPAQTTAAPAAGLQSQMLVAVVLALVAGGAAWGAIQSVDPLFLVPEEFHIKELGAPEARHLKLREEQGKVDCWNAAVDLAMFGVLLAGALGLAETIGRRSVVPVLIALPVGALFGALAGLAGFAAFQAWSTGGLLSSVESAAKVQGAMLAVLGAGCGLAVGLSTRSPRFAGTALLAGAVGGGMAGILYPIVASFVLPTAGTELLIPRGGVNRLLWIELAAGLLACIVLGAGRERPPQAAPAINK